MDGLVVGVLFLVLLIRHYSWGRAADTGVENPDISVERIHKNAALNPEMLHDEHAFMVIANELGFH